MTPLERAARALAKEFDCHSGDSDEIETREHLRYAFPGAGHFDLLAIARVVLTAIREPSEGMAAAGFHVSMEAGEGFADETAVWQAMIDGLLNEADAQGIETRSAENPKGIPSEG